MANYNIQSHHSSGNQLEENKRWIILKPHGTLRLVYVDFDIFLSIPHHYGLTNVEKSGMTTLRFACQVFRTSILSLWRIYACLPTEDLFSNAADFLHGWPEKLLNPLSTLNPNCLCLLGASSSHTYLLSYSCLELDLTYHC
jgi:hypothetical protein